MWCNAHYDVLVKFRSPVHPLDGNSPFPSGSPTASCDTMLSLLHSQPKATSSNRNPLVLASARYVLLHYHPASIHVSHTDREGERQRDRDRMRQRQKFLTETKPCQAKNQIILHIFSVSPLLVSLPQMMCTQKQSQFL